MTVRSVIYKSELTENTDRKFGSTNAYYPAWIVDEETGIEVPALFTSSAMSEATQRAIDNKEDVKQRQKASTWTEVWSNLCELIWDLFK